MKFRACLAIAVIAIACVSRASAQPATKPAAEEAIHVTVLPGARQTFAGFGAGVSNFNSYYTKLPKAAREELARLIWRDLKFKTLRLWMQTNEYAPQPGMHDLKIFKETYIDSGVIADAKKFGCTTLLLAPDSLPDSMKEKHDDGTLWLKASETANYAKLLADCIQQLKVDYGVTINATGIQNEASDMDRFAPELMADVVAKLRADLDGRGLKDVKIIATENSSASREIFCVEVDALKANPLAWKGLAGIASHSYNMAATEEVAQRIAGPKGENTKEYWMTEAADGGNEVPGDIFRAISMPARFLNDMNHRVTHWIHFQAYENVRPDDIGCCILTFKNDPPKITPFLKYQSYLQLTNTFDVGAVFRHSQSSLEGEMTWTYGPKPRVIVAAAKNPDGTWAIGITNFTADSFKKVYSDTDEKWNVEQGGFTPARTFNVTIEVAELKNAGPVKFAVRQTNAKVANAAGQSLVMKNGLLTLPMASMELITLRSAPLR